MEQTEVGVEEYLQLLEHLELVVAPCFGPCGRRVLVTSTTGGPCAVSKDGETILDVCVGTNPLLNWVKDRVKGYHERSGDSSKCFVLLLAELLRKVKTHHSHRDQYDDSSLERFSRGLSGQFAFLAREVVCSDDLMSSINAVCAETSCGDSNALWEFAKRVIFSVLQGNLGEDSARLLGDLAVEFVQTPSPEAELERTVTFILDNFPFLCQEVGGYPITDSHITEGVLIPRDLAYRHPSLGERATGLNVVLMSCDFVAEDQTASSSCITLSSTEDIALLASSSKRKWSRFIRKLQGQKIRAILSVDIVPEPLMALLRLACISVVHSVLKEDLTAISHRTGIPVMYDPEEDISSFIHNVNFFKRIILGKQSFSCVGFQDKTGQPLQQLVICGPTGTMCRSYSSSIQNALKSFRMCFDTNAFNDKSDKEPRLHAVYGGGVVEIVASNVIKGYRKSYSNEKTKLALLCFAEALEVIPRTLHDNSYEVNYQKYLEGKMRTRQESQPWQGIDARMGHWVPAAAVGIIEPLMSKSVLWQNVLETLCDLLRIDSQIGFLV